MRRVRRFYSVLEFVCAVTLGLLVGAVVAALYVGSHHYLDAAHDLEHLVGILFWVYAGPTVALVVARITVSVMVSNRESREIREEVARRMREDAPA